MGTDWLVGLAFVWAVFGLLGGYISDQKGRSAWEGLILGMLFGPFGALIAALLPNLNMTGAARHAAPKPGPTPEEIQAQRELAAARAKILAEIEANEAAQEKADRERRERLKADAQRATSEGWRAVRESIAWLISFRWFRAWPETAQAIFIGVAIAFPVLVILARLLG